MDRYRLTGHRSKLDRIVGFESESEEFAIHKSIEILNSDDFYFFEKATLQKYRKEDKGFAPLEGESIVSAFHLSPVGWRAFKLVYTL